MSNDVLIKAVELATKAILLSALAPERMGESPTCQLLKLRSFADKVRLCENFSDAQKINDELVTEYRCVFDEFRRLDMKCPDGELSREEMDRLDYATLSAILRIGGFV